MLVAVNANIASAADASADPRPGNDESFVNLVIL
jgi:hypothetical protein